MIPFIHHIYLPCIHMVWYKACALASCVSVRSVGVAASKLHDDALVVTGKVAEKRAFILLAGHS